MEIIARKHVIIRVKLKFLKKKVLGRLATLDSCHVGLPLPQGLGRLATLASCRVGLPLPQGLGRLAVAGLVPRLACRRPRVRQTPHAGLMPRSRPLKFKFPVPVLKNMDFSNPTKQGGMLSVCHVLYFSTFSQMQIVIKTVPVLNNTLFEPRKARVNATCF